MGVKEGLSFYRYTNLAATIHLLTTKRITLLNPATWDDKNDAYLMAEYKRLKGAKTVLALCFAQGRETYHHWRIFSNGQDGTRIMFSKEDLLSTFENDPRTKMDRVDYKMIRHLKRQPIDVEKLPFLKRLPYKDENEYRVVYVDHEESKEYQDYEIEISWIAGITLSPWMSKGLASSVVTTLKSIEGCSGLSIHLSTVIENESWKKLTARVRDS